MLSKGTKIAVAAASLIGSFTTGGIVQRALDYDRLDSAEVEALRNEEAATECVMRLVQAERMNEQCIQMYTEASKEVDEYSYRFKVCLGILKGERD